MARTSIKSTYSLDVETVRKLERVASRWKVSKSEVLRRAIDTVAKQESPPEKLTPLEALHELQKRLKLSKREAEDWARSVRDERTASSLRHEWRRR